MTDGAPATAGDPCHGRRRAERRGLAAGLGCARGSANIAALQVALRAQRLYAGSVDGIDGPGTVAAVRRLQRRSRLDADGIAGPLTRRTLGRRGRPALGSRVVGPGDRGWDVAALQFLLAWRGFPSGARIDGGFGEHTGAVIVRCTSTGRA